MPKDSSTAPARSMIDTLYGSVDPEFCHPIMQEQIALLGQADPFLSQRELVMRLREQIGDLPDSVLDYRPAPGEWTCREVVAHLVQTEIVYGYRYRAILAEPEGHLAGYDQEKWVDRLPEARWPLEELLDHLAALKRLNVAVLEQIPDDRRHLWGVHGERGRESLGCLIGAIAGHDVLHERQIAANLEAWRAEAL